MNIKIETKMSKENPIPSMGDLIAAQIHKTNELVSMGIPVESAVRIIYPEFIAEKALNTVRDLREEQIFKSFLTK